MRYERCKETLGKGETMIYSYSSLDLYERCPRLFRYHYEDKTDVREDPLSARFGTWMVHWPITSWYEAHRLGYQQHFNPNFNYLWEEIVRPTDVELADKKNKPYTLAMARGLYEEYVSRFDRDFDLYRVVSVEDYKIVGNYGTKGDVILERKSDGVIVPMDLKSSKSDFILEGAHVNNQFLGQMFVHGTLECMVSLLNTADGKVERLPIKVTQAAMDDWIDELAYRIVVVDASREVGVWPRNAPNSCFKFGRWCRMKGVYYGE